MSKFYTYDAWVDTFKPIKNSLVKYDQLHFETYGEEVEFVAKQDPKTIWTEVDGDGGTYIIAGFHYVNRIHYYVTENPWEDEYTEVPTWMERQCDCQDDAEEGIYCDECEEREGYITIPCDTVKDLKVIYGEGALIVA
jgi:hypothetical protein